MKLEIVETNTFFLDAHIGLFLIFFSCYVGLTFYKNVCLEPRRDESLESHTELNNRSQVEKNTF